MIGKKRVKGMTLAEHDAMLKSNGKYDAMIEKASRQEEERQSRAAEWRRAEKPMVEELRAEGFSVESAWDLVNASHPYQDALPILMKHLQRPYPDAVREGIARALAVPEARFGWDVLIRMYIEEQNSRAKDGLAIAICAAANDELVGDVIALVRDKEHGPSRLLLLNALERSTDPRARVALMELCTDPDLKKEVLIILHRLKQTSR